MLPQQIHHCPITPECSKRLLYIDVPLEDVKAENVHYVNSKGQFLPHVCSIRNASSKPELSYLSAWKNHRTGRTRYMGPFRTRNQAEKSPKDDKFDPQRRGTTHQEWSLMAVYVTKNVWKSAPPKRG